MADKDPHEIQPRLAARRESLPSAAVLPRTVASVVRAAPTMSRRERARHFSSKPAAKAVRPPRASVSGRRRVIVKARVVRMGPAARKALLEHVRYVERDGAGERGESERFFDRDSDLADGRAFVDRCSGDRHHFRLIVSPEDGHELPDLKAYARNFMSRVERDLGTEIDWIAGAHHDTGRPHLHILMRGKRLDGRDLVIPRDYVSHGLRYRSQELATEILGPRLERSATADRDVAADRFTAIDRTLLELAKEGQLASSDLPDPHRIELLRRLTHLETRGWIAREEAGLWRIPDDLRRTLQDAGEQEARERAAQKAVLGSAVRGDITSLQAAELRPGEVVLGAYAGHAPIGPFRDGPQALVLDLVDGRLAHIRTESLAPLLILDRTPEAALVEVIARPRGERPADATIAEIAAERGGVWSASDHKAARPFDRTAFIERHHRRLEAMSREGACEALGDGRFHIPADYRARAWTADRRRDGNVELEVRVADPRPLREQIRESGVTYLDRELAGWGRAKINALGFGAHVRTALAERADVLRSRGLGSGDPFKLASEEVRELVGASLRAISDELGRGAKPVGIASEGRRFSGVYLSRVNVGGVTYAVVEGRHAITLAPWRPALEACRGQALTGMLQAGAVDFSRGLERGLDLSL